MLEVGVHLHEHVVATMHTPGETVPVGRTEPCLRRTAEQLDAAYVELAGQALHHRRSAVRASVVDDEHLGPRHGGQDRGDHRADVGRLVVGGDDYQRSQHSVGLPPA